MKTQKRPAAPAWRRPLGFAAIVLSGFLLCYSAWSYFTHPTPSAPDFAQEITAAQQAGVPVRAQDLQAPLPPSAQNAAPLYTRIDTLLKSRPLEKRDRIADIVAIRHGMPSQEQWERARRAIRHRSDLLLLIHQAAARPQCVFVHDWSHPLAVIIPEIDTMRYSARMLETESLVMAQSGRPLEAVHNLTHGFQIARHAAAERTLGAYAAALAIDAITQIGLQKILYLSGTDPAVADAVRMALESGWTPHSLAHAVQNEVGIDMVELERMRKRGPASMSELLSSSLSKPLHMDAQEWDRFIDINGSLLLRRARRVIAAADLSYQQSDPALRAVAAEFDQDKDSQHLLNLLLFQGYPKNAYSQAQPLAQAGVIRAAAAILAWKDRHGAMPQTLAEAMASVPMDPFDGKPIQYHREGTGFVVFSAGENGTYTGGAPERWDKREVVFRYPLPAYLRGPLQEDN